MSEELGSTILLAVPVFLRHDWRPLRQQDTRARAAKQYETNPLLANQSQKIACAAHRWEFLEISLVPQAPRLQRPFS